ncbi:protein NDUFAF4 homolog [Orussus abietinus]|uniref:protein NDUFAF4 homolog n=1 Tax=Orussus abietinus TaxID=222816 RepID=UPI0006259CB5|nr:protein NDUFAF4 homolog [Orussus abietinus]XP_012276589.1 protein NDUFAF4 homolog [Orussus abietinus]XP_012276590.1 protein NDUFAF4 homolog [Orussus abietinus]XP_012276591.1 protein NDUFAF4 homolog [Orussus abietinus]
MGKVYSILGRRLQRFNVDNRAQKILSRDKQNPAPQYKSTQEQLNIVKKLYPDFMEKHNKKDKELDHRLKDVRIVSHDPEGIKENVKSDPKRSLPHERITAPEFEFGFYEPSVIPEGKCSLKQVLKLIENHAQDPQTHTAASIAQKYKLDPKHVENILRYYKMYELVLPKTTSKSDKLKFKDNFGFLKKMIK